MKLERLMEITLEEIRGSKFAQEWSEEFNADYPRLRNLLNEPPRDGRMGARTTDHRRAPA
ncbi:MAG: hypothetical protein IPK17_30375 [Chloroflexi bacterium]|uniref:hypothetical protein n=1 Tax=Candidatus Flexifilum breve TaxID=3140694 RepID=UPI003135AB84|nr:hypothetical protein [Chloroflexota bacterium]